VPAGGGVVERLEGEVVGPNRKPSTGRRVLAGRGRRQRLRCQRRDRRHHRRPHRGVRRADAPRRHRRHRPPGPGAINLAVTPGRGFLYSLAGSPRAIQIFGIEPDGGLWGCRSRGSGRRAPGRSRRASSAGWLTSTCTATGSAGAIAIAESPHLAALEHLRIGGTPLASKAGGALRARFSAGAALQLLKPRQRSRDRLRRDGSPRAGTVDVARDLSASHRDLEHQAVVSRAR
jgi:hypothetical protein